MLAGEQDEMDAVLSKRTVIQLSGRGPPEPLLRVGPFGGSEAGVGRGGVGKAGQRNPLKGTGV